MHAHAYPSALVPLVLGCLLAAACGGTVTHEEGPGEGLAATGGAGPQSTEKASQGAAGSDGDFGQPLQAARFVDYRTDCSHVAPIAASLGDGGASSVGGPELLAVLDGEVTLLRTDASHVYAVRHEEIERDREMIGIDLSDGAQTLIGRGGGYLEVDDDNAFYVAKSRLHRRPKTGGGQTTLDVPDLIGTCDGLQMAPEHVLLLHKKGVLAVPKASPEDAVFLTGSSGPTELREGFFFDGRVVYWGQGQSGGAAVETLDVETGSRGALYSKPREYDSEVNRLLAVDCGHAYLETCEDGKRFCIVRRIRKDDGAASTIAGIERGTAMRGLVALNGTVFYARGRYVHRLDASESEPIDVWHGVDSEGFVSTLFADDDNLFFAYVENAKSQIFRLPLR